MAFVRQGTVHKLFNRKSHKGGLPWCCEGKVAAEFMDGPKAYLVQFISGGDCASGSCMTIKDSEKDVGYFVVDVPVAERFVGVTRSQHAAMKNSLKKSSGNS